MSRGYLDYENEILTEIADDLQNLINNNENYENPESNAVISIYKTAIGKVKELDTILYAIDSYLSCDWGELTLLEDYLENCSNTFLRRSLKERIKFLRIEQKDYLTVNKETLKIAKENGDKIEKLDDGYYRVTYKEYLDSLKEE